MSNDPVQTSYWNNCGPRQNVYDRLFSELIPTNGHSDTVEGELLRCFAWMAHDAYNNGGGNNYSGALLYVRRNLPGFKSEWYAGLYEEIVDGHLDGKACEIIEQMGEAILDNALANEGQYSPNNISFSELRAEYLDAEGPAHRPMSFEEDDIEDEEDEPDYSLGR